MLNLLYGMKEDPKARYGLMGACAEGGMGGAMVVELWLIAMGPLTISCNCPGSAVGSGDAEFRDEMVWITGEGYEDIPSLLSGGGQDRADDREVLRAILGTEPA